MIRLSGNSHKIVGNDNWYPFVVSVRKRASVSWIQTGARLFVINTTQEARVSYQCIVYWAQKTAHKITI